MRNTNLKIIMKKLIISIIFTLILGCNNSSENRQPDLVNNKTEVFEETEFKKYLNKDIDSTLKKLNLKPLADFKSKIIRIWIFPGGGADYEQMIEYNSLTSELIFYSILFKQLENTTEISNLSYTKELGFSKTLNDRKIKRKIKAIISKSDFKNTKDSDEYCVPFDGCADLYYVEYTDGEKVIQFTISHDIEKCDNPKAKNLLKIFKIANEVIKIADPDNFEQ